MLLARPAPPSSYPIAKPAQTAAPPSRPSTPPLVFLIPSEGQGDARIYFPAAPNITPGWTSQHIAPHRRRLRRGKAWRLAREQASERHWLNNKTSKQGRCKQANKTTQAMDPGAIHVRTMYHADAPCDITHPAYRVCACALALVSAAENGWAGGHAMSVTRRPVPNQLPQQQQPLESGVC